MKEKTATDIQKNLAGVQRSLKAGEQVAVMKRGKLLGYYRKAGAHRKPDRSCLPPAGGELSAAQIKAIAERITNG